jgi:hypothetical protein
MSESSEPNKRLQILLTEYVKQLLADELCRNLPEHMHAAVREVVEEFARDG